MATGSKTKSFLCVVDVPAEGKDPEFRWQQGGGSTRTMIRNVVALALRDAGDDPEKFPGIASARPGQLTIEVSGRPVGLDDLHRMLPILERAASATDGAATKKVGTITVRAEWSGPADPSQSTLERTVESGKQERGKQRDPGRGMDSEEEEYQGFQAIRKVLDELERGLPKDYASRVRQLGRLHDTVRQAIADALAPSLNEVLPAKPHETYEQKKELGKWVNAELRRFGLAINQGGQPCLLVADPVGRSPAGRFVLDYVTVDGLRVHAKSSVLLPQLNLMPDDLSRVPYGSRTGRSR